MSDVEVLLTVGKLDASLALLTTQDHHVIEFPTMLLPDNVKAGSIVKLSVSQNSEEEKRQLKLFKDIQTKILEKYGIEKPKAPILKIVNVTQTSCVLAWDPLSLGSARLKSLILYRQGVRSMVIPSPLKTIMTKISGLSIDTDYEFQLKLSTTSGQYWSEKVKMHTHKMTDMSGITVCLGSLDPSQNISGEQIAESLQKVGARQMQKHTAIDTTHFVTNDADNKDDPELVRAKSSNIPIVRPEWVRACEVEKRIVGVRGFYLDADPGILKSYQFPKANGSKVKFANEAETIDDKKPEAEKESEGEESNKNDEGPGKDREEVNPESTDSQEDANLDKLKEANEATTETTMELNYDATQSDQNISVAKKDEGSVLTQEARDVENRTTETHKKSEELPTSLEPSHSKGQEEEYIKQKADSSEDSEAMKSEEAGTDPNVGKRLDTGEETLEITSEDIKDEASESKTEKTEEPSVPDSAPVPEEQPDIKDEASESKTEKTEEPSVPDSAPVPEEQPDIKEETFVNGLIEIKDKIPKEDGEVTVSDPEKGLNAEEEKFEVRPEDKEQEKVEDSSIPVPAPVPENQPDIKEETFVNGSNGTQDKMPEEDGKVAISDSEKGLNPEEQTLEVRPEDNKDEITKSEQEKVEDSSIPAPATAVPGEQPDIKEETFVNGPVGIEDKMPTEDGETASERQLNSGEENRSGDINTDIIEANVEKVNAENEKAEKGQGFAEAKPEEIGDLQGLKVSYPEVRSSETGETNPSEGVSQEDQRDEFHIREPAETNISQVPDTSQDSELNVEVKEATPESSSSQPKNVGNGKKNKKKNKNKKK